MAKFYGSWVCMISAVICMLPRWVWHLCNLPCVYALFKLISIARYAFESPWISFEETKHEIYHEHVANLPSILWRRARLWLKLFANTVGRFLLRITSLSSYVFLRMVFPEQSRTTERLSLTLRGLSLRQTAKMKLLPSVFSSLNSRVKIFVFVANSRRHVSIFMWFNEGLEEKNKFRGHLCSLPFDVSPRNVELNL